VASLEPSDPRLLLKAPPLRQLAQLAVALAGWAVFLYWWWLVFTRVSRREIAYTGLFVGVTTVLAVTVTGLWSLHNKRLSRRRAPRSQVRVVREDYSADTLQRRVSFTGGLERVRTEALLDIVVSENEKIYQPAGSGRGRDG
jgi:hypothetical protein